MTKEELCVRVAELNDIESKAASRRVVEHIISTIKEEVTAGNEVQVTGLGKFYPQKQEARSGVSPLGGKWSKPATTLPKFKASKAFKSAVGS